MWGTTKGYSPLCQFLYKVSHPNPSLQYLMPATISGDTYISPGSSLCLSGWSACVSPASVPIFVHPPSSIFWWKGVMIVIISASVSTNAAYRHLRYGSLYCFPPSVGFRAAMVVSALLKHSCGSRLLPTFSPDIIRMEFSKWLCIIIHSNNLLSACGFFSLDYHLLFLFGILMVAGYTDPRLHEVKIFL